MVRDSGEDIRILGKLRSIERCEGRYNLVEKSILVNVVCVVLDSVMS